MAGPVGPPSSSAALTEPLLVGGSDEGPNDNASAPIPSHSQQLRNIKFILCYTVLMFAGRSMWSQTVLSAYVYLLRDNNAEAVGLLTAIMGISQLLVSFPTGCLADKFRRDTLLKSASAFGFVAISTTVVAVRRRSYSLLALALALWGALWGIVYTTISALFADSVPDGKRSLWFTRRVVLIKLGNMVGPIVVLVMFYLLGDKWTTKDCSVVMMVGQAVCIIPLLLLCWMKDIESQEDNDSQSHSNADDPEQAQDLLPRADEESTEIDASQNEADEEIPSAPLCFCLSKERFIPRMVACSDIMFGIANGMSIRYFPIFFLSNLRLSPVVVQILFFFSVVGQIPLSIVAQRGAKRIGRCQMTVLLKWIGVTCFVVMILSYRFRLSSVLISILWVGRTSFMNSCSALTKSIIMDSVPQRERGQWSALESVNMFSWSGSAFLGGILVGEEGILFNFCITSALQLISTIPLILLFGKVRAEGESQSR